MYNLLPFINSSGITVPISALRSKNDFGIGDIEDAYKFIDFLAKSGMSVWKLLPVNQTVITGYDSPYDTESAFAIDMLYIDITDLADVDYKQIGTFLDILKGNQDKNNKIEFERVRKIKSQILKIAFSNFYSREYVKGTMRAHAFREFIQEEEYWLEDYALFKVFQKECGEIFLGLWPEEIRNRDEATLKAYKKAFELDILYFKYLQWVIHTQWQKLKSYANEKGIYLIGDVPSFVEVQSADVWAQRNQFNVDGNFVPTIFGGAPPDQFASEGQVWGMANSNWDEQKKNEYTWWKNRLKHMSNYFDGLRLDYFMGFVEFWAIEPGKKATEGRWEKGPGLDFFNNVIKDLQDEHLCKFIAEVPTIDPSTIAHIDDVRAKLGIDLCVIFTFDYKHLIQENIQSWFCLETTTHDTSPFMTQWDEKISWDSKTEILQALGIEGTPPDVMDSALRWSILEKLYEFPFHTVIFPIQDILGMKDQINVPGTVGGDNWGFRLDRYLEEMLEDEAICEKLNSLSKKSLRDKNFHGYGMRSIPWINSRVQREYSVGEVLSIWVLAQEEGDVVAVSDMAEDMPFSFLEKTANGYVYRVQYLLKKAGNFFLTVKQGDTYISGYKEDMKIIVK